MGAPLNVLLLACFVAFLACTSAVRSTPKAQARIRSLPGYNGPLGEMYSGYITVDEAHGRQLFYWFVPSQNPRQDPLVLWLQGGPGCSGLFGFLDEHGPLTPSRHSLSLYKRGLISLQDEVGGLQQNPYTWQRVANMLYIESPAGVGFSYSNNQSDYNTNDLLTAQDNYRFLRGFFQIYPEFQTNRLWITGESYGGVYVPTLTYQILIGPDVRMRKQLQGIVVGNGVFSCNIDYNAIQFNLFYWHGLVSFTNYANWTAHGCDKNSGAHGCNYIFNITVSQLGIVDQQMLMHEQRFRSLPGSNNQPSLDPDNLYQDFCTGNGTLEFTDPDPFRCKQPVGDRTTNYLNRADVQRAIHARPTVWNSCTSSINYVPSGDSMLPYYDQFFNASLKVLVYSGDVDVATVPFALNQACLGQLARRNIQSWAPWFVNGATAGYVEYFDKYTFATIKGAGHESPLYQPLSAYNMFSRFIKTGNLTDTEHLPLELSVPKTSALQGRTLRSFGIRP